TVKLREHSAALADCLDRVLAGLREVIPDLGADLAIDGSDLPAFANGHRDLPNGKPRERYADPDASWGHRSAISTRKGGGFYGYKLHAAVCTKTDLPIAWRVGTASASEHKHMPSLLDTAIRRGFTPGTCAMDKGYDGSAMYEACESRVVRPVIPLKQTLNVAEGKHKPPSCQHDVWTFAGSDTKRSASKWRCRPGRASPPVCGSRLTGCTLSSRAPPTGGRRSTAPGALSSASSACSSTSGACCRCGFVVCLGCGCTWI
ncbi:MAG: transposase, partial [Actinomycetota bacterium]|nr:transposase [Actinomycetota bacterium]